MSFEAGTNPFERNLQKATIESGLREYDVSLSNEGEPLTNITIEVAYGEHTFEVKANLITWKRLTEAVTRSTPYDVDREETNRLRREATTVADKFIEEYKRDDLERNFH